MIKSVSYTKSYWIGSYLQHKIELGIDLDPGQSPEDALTEAKNRVDAWDKDNNVYSPPATHVEGVIQVDKEGEIDKELEDAKIMLSSIKTKELAEEWLKKSPFKYNTALQLIVKNKQQ